MDVERFIHIHGTRTLSLLVARFIELAPEFEGDCLLAQELGSMVGDLEFALEGHGRKGRAI